MRRGEGGGSGGGGAPAPHQRQHPRHHRHHIERRPHPRPLGERHRVNVLRPDLRARPAEHADCPPAPPAGAHLCLVHRPAQHCEHRVPVMLCGARGCEAGARRGDVRFPGVAQHPPVPHNPHPDLVRRPLEPQDGWHNLGRECQYAPRGDQGHGGGVERHPLHRLPPGGAGAAHHRPNVCRSAPPPRRLRSPRPPPCHGTGKSTEMVRRIRRLVRPCAPARRRQRPEPLVGGAAACEPEVPSGQVGDLSTAHADGGLRRAAQVRGGRPAWRREHLDARHGGRDAGGAGGRAARAGA